MSRLSPAEAMPQPPPGYYPSDSDIQKTLSTCIYLGSASPKFEYYTMGEVIKRYADYAWEVKGNVTVEGISERFGSSPFQARWLLETFGGPDNFTGTVLAMAYQIIPRLPHPTIPEVVIPLFATFTAITTLIMALRLWSRYKVAGGIQPFDWLAVVGFILTVAWGALAVEHHKINTEWQAFYDKSWYHFSTSSEMYLALTLFYPWVMMFIKLSLLLFYYRMTNWNYIRWSVYATTFVVVGNTLAAFIMWLVQYPHVQYWKYLWEQPRFPAQEAQVAIAAIYIVTDVIIWVLPMPLVFQLKLYPRERILALITFSLGAVACVASCVRLYMITQYTKFSSRSTTTIMINAWTIIELYLALICASAPAVRALAIHYAPKILNSLGTVAFASTATSAGKKGSVGSNNSTSGSNTKVGAQTKVTADPEKQ